MNIETLTSKHDRAENLSIKELMSCMGTSHPTRQSYHDALKRKDLTNVNQDGNTVLINVGQFCDLVESGGFGKRRGSRKSENNAPRDPGEDRGAGPPDQPESAMPIELAIKPVPSGVIDTVIEEPGELDADQLKNLVLRAGELGNENAAAEIKRLAGMAERDGLIALRAGRRALACAWACGKLLARVKATLKHGRFGAWIKDHIEPGGPGLRTCQRYLKLAEDWSTLDDLIQNHPALFKIDEAGVVLGTDEAVEDTAAGVNAPQGKPARDANWVLSQLTRVHKVLAQACQQPPKLDDQQRAQLELVFGELIKLAQSLIHGTAESDTNQEEAAA